MRLLAEWRRAMREEKPMFLEFKAPPNDRLGITKGMVVEVHCVLPDGTIEGGRR
jgi:hypothetical protein